MNEHAQALGRMAAGKPKRYNQAELDRRTELLKKAREKRWEGHVRKQSAAAITPDLEQQSRHS